MDKDKLIAARKRLKEYQEKKHAQENHMGQQNHFSNENKLPNEVPAVNDEKLLETDQNSRNTPIQTDDYQNSSNLNVANFFHENVVQNSGQDVQNVFENTFHPTESQISNIQNSFMEVANHTISEPAITQEENNVSNHTNENMNLNFANDRQEMYAAIQTVKESFVQQKEQMQQMSNAIQDVFENKNNEPVNFDGFYNQRANDETRNVIEGLQRQLQQSENKIHEMEMALSAKDSEWSERLTRELSSLQNQLQAHEHTTSILVAEKAELSTALDQNQHLLQQKADEVKDLWEKFKTSQSRATELEKELLFIRSNNNDVQKACQQLQQRYDEIWNQFSELRKTKEDLELESSELKQKLNMKNTDLANLQQELQEKIALLSLSDLKIQQLTNSPQEAQGLDNQRNIVAVYEQQLAELKDTIKNLTEEKSDAGNQYKSYVQQLDERHAQITSELEVAKKRISEFESREESYIQRLSDMEQHLQRERSKSESLMPTEDYQGRIDILTKNIDHLVLEQESLQAALNSKDAEIEQLKNQLSESSETKDQEVDTSKLLSALESEQLGAARAVSQNQQLKNQLNEMHDAFVTLSNAKLELTEQLQAERSIGKKLNMMLNDVEAQLDEVRAQLAEKEAALLEIEKDKLRSAALEDHIQHYQAQSHHAGTVQQELANALIMVENLKKENERLTEKLNIKLNSVINSEESPESNGHVESIPEIDFDKTESNDIRIRKISTETQTSKLADEESFTIPEPLKKLEVKFKQTMEQVAELTDEKQRLEHLVLQLQGETETIGEYIALYQKQRAILHERAREKERSFKSLLEQRNTLQEQLHKLKVLVADLIRRKLNGSQEIEQAPINDHENNTEIVASSDQPSNIIEPLTPELDLKDKTTSEILDLLTEIKDCGDTCSFEPDFHPCPWCSGKLITV